MRRYYDVSLQRSQKTEFRIYEDELDGADLQDVAWELARTFPDSWDTYDSNGDVSMGAEDA